MLHAETVAPRTLEILKALMRNPMLADFHLVGGTALVLQLGHRISTDLDLFTYQPFLSEVLIGELKTAFGFRQQVDRGYFVRGFIEDVKIDLLKYPYPPIDAEVRADGIRMLSPKDIAPMKLSAVTNRGRKRDFVDVYVLLQHFDLKTMVGWYVHKCGGDPFMLRQSLTYFDDAEHDTDLKMLFQIRWETIKKRIEEEVRSWERNLQTD